MVCFKKVARAVERQALRLARFGREGSLASGWGKFEDRACVPNKQITREIKGQCRGEVENREGTLGSTGSEFEELAGAGLCDKQIARAVKGQS